MIKHLQLFYTGLLVLVCNCLFPQTKTIPFQELPAFNGVIPGSGIFFGASMTTSSLTVTFAGPADRWFAFGFGSLMAPADVLMYSNGTFGSPHALGWFDYNNVSPAGPVIDVNQNWTIVSTGTTSPTQRTVTATRALNTGDAIDVVINFTSTNLNLIWARGASANYTIDTHGTTNRAFGISLPWLSAPTASFSTASTTLCQGSSLLYTNASSGGQTTYTWSFQGGNPAVSNATNQSVAYTTPGTYSVALTASNAVGTNVLTQINYVTVTPTVAPSVSISQTAGTNPMCAGSLANFTATPVNGGSSPTYQWKVNGSNSGVTTSTFGSTTLPNPAVITCLMTSNASCANPVSATSAAITMTVNSTAPATASIAVISGNNPMCVGAPIVFSVSAGNGGTSPSFQWNVNSVNLGSGSTFSSTTLTNGSVVNCSITSNAPCASSTLGVSAGITMTVSSVLVPGISTALTGTNSFFCAGTPVIITATAVNGGTTPSFQWQVNNVNTGVNSATFTSAGLNNGSVIRCILTSNLGCASPQTATSTAITISVNPVPATPTITASSSTTFCADKDVTLSSSATSGNLWSNGAVSQTILVSTPGTYSVIQTLNGCTSLPSAQIPVVVYPVPSASISPIGPVCKSPGDIVLNYGIPGGGTYSVNGVAAGFLSQAIAGSFMISYRISDNKGCASTATTVALIDECLGVAETEIMDGKVTIFPNPGTGLLTIRSTEEKILSVSVIDMGGKLVFKRSGNEQKILNLDLSGENAGIYTLELELNSRTIKTRISKTNP